MVVKRILALVVPVVLGALAGAMIGGIITGSGDYAIAWGLGIPVGIVAVTALVVSRSTAGKKKAAAKADPVGINETVTGRAGGTAGVVLNGEPMAAVATAPGPERPVRLRRGIAVVLTAAGAALALIPAYTMIGWVASDIVQGRPFDGRDMRTGLHQNDAMAQIAEVVGSPDITNVNFYDSYVIVTARTSPRSTTTDSYMWRYGSAFRNGPSGFEPDLANELFDASKIDFSIIPELITIAKRDAGMNDADTYYPAVRRGPGDESGPGEPEISISLSNDYFDAYYTFSLDGELIDKSGTAFE